MKHLFVVLSLMMTLTSFAGNEPKEKTNSVPTRTIVIRPDPTAPQLAEVKCSHGDPWYSLVRTIGGSLLIACVEIKCTDGRDEVHCFPLGSLMDSISPAPLQVNLDLNINWVVPNNPSQITPDMLSQSYNCKIYFPEEVTLVDGDVMVIFRAGWYSQPNRQLKVIATEL